MKILFHRYVFDHIDLFEEACLHVLEGKEVHRLTCTREKDRIVFDEKTKKQKNYDAEGYVELDERDLKGHLQFAFDIEQGIFPD